MSRPVALAVVAQVSRWSDACSCSTSCWTQRCWATTMTQCLAIVSVSASALATETETEADAPAPLSLVQDYRDPTRTSAASRLLMASLLQGLAIQTCAFHLAACNTHVCVCTYFLCLTYIDCFHSDYSNETLLSQFNQSLSPFLQFSLNGILTYTTIRKSRTIKVLQLQTTPIHTLS